jgi:rhodanese-related sulfurtransferase
MNVASLRLILVEAGAIAVAGLLVALTANQLSPRGIALRRDYFPSAPAPAAVSTPSSALAGVDPASAGVARLARRGLNVAPLSRVQELFHDPRFSEGRVVFVDARDDRSFEAGHIPGAIQLDHYRLDRHIARVVAACAIAEQIVVYCNGGSCEDSELAAGDLLDLGVPAAKILVFVAGFEEWRRQGLPVTVPSRPGDGGQRR